MKVNNISSSILTGAGLNASSLNQETHVSKNTQNATIMSQIAINTVIEDLIGQLSSNIKQREELLALLPKGIERLTRKLMEEHYESGQTLAKGLTAIIASQRELTTKLNSIISASEVFSINEQYAHEPIFAEIFNELNCLSDAERQQTAQILRRVIASLPSDTSHQTNIQPHHSAVISLTLPFYFENSIVPYTTHIQIYHRPPERDANDQEIPKDTWLRIITTTQNMGSVEVIFHLHSHKQVDVRVVFASSNASQAFSEVIPEIRDSLTRTLQSFSLSNISYFTRSCFTKGGQYD